MQPFAGWGAVCHEDASIKPAKVCTYKRWGVSDDNMLARADAWGEFYDRPPCNPGQELRIMDSDGMEFCSPPCNSKKECPKADQGDTLCKWDMCFNTCNTTS